MSPPLPAAGVFALAPSSSGWRVFCLNSSVRGKSLLWCFSCVTADENQMKGETLQELQRGDEGGGGGGGGEEEQEKSRVWGPPSCFTPFSQSKLEAAYGMV